MLKLAVWNVERSALKSARVREAQQSLIIALGADLVLLTETDRSFALPGCAILCAALAELEEDGLMLLFAGLFLVLTVAYFAVILYLVFIVGDRSLDLFYRFVPDWLGALRG